jgi:hypothetical protein
MSGMRMTSYCLSAKAIWAVGLVSVLLACGPGLAGTPGKINYQGPIVDTDTGDTPEGTNTMIFRVFDQADGGAKLWSESQVAEVGSMGIFSVILASTNSIDLSFSAPDWIEVGGRGRGP